MNIIAHYVEVNADFECLKKDFFVCIAYLTPKGGMILLERSGKLRPLYLFKLLYELTDEDHPLTTNELLQLLNDRFSIKTQRTRIAQDIEALEDFGFEIGRVRGQSNNYYFDKRSFEPAELKLLIDAVQSSLFITEKKSRELTEKIAKLAPAYIEESLLRLSGDYVRLKQSNEQIYYIVDALNRAILQGKQVSFGYFEYDIYKRRKLRHDGAPYTLSPYALVWDNDLYYVVGYYEKYNIIANFRVDRIARVPEILDQPIIPEPDGFDLDEYRSSMMRMYNSERRLIELACDFSVMDAIIDKFGEEVDTGLIDEKTFSVTVETAVNHIFYSWIFGFGGKVRILEPRDVVEGYADMVLHAANVLVREL